MAREWKPGNVALVKFAWQTSREPLVCIRAVQQGAPGWLHPGGLSGFTSDRAPAGPVSVRPLVVLDPEDREQVERLARAVWDRSVGPGGVPAFQAALRSLLEPPKPPEPQGLGAVVIAQCGGGNREPVTKVREVGDRRNWVDRDGYWHAWADLRDVETVQEGWSE